MDEAYQAADCLVHPTLEDTYAMVVLEAMAHGLPVVVSGALWCGIAGELQHHVHAIVLDNPTLPNELQASVELVFRELDLAQMLSNHGVEFARRRTWHHVAAMHENLYIQAQA
jgi:UDP-glucose:(heptosyl)LPS alpha-1,3-glucosyltransferase